MQLVNYLSIIDKKKKNLSFTEVIFKNWVVKSENMLYIKVGVQVMLPIILEKLNNSHIKEVRGGLW